jgi:choline dehydrogenase-like flavoprotein
MPATSTRTNFLSATKKILTPAILEKHFSWIRGRQVGGKSITWGRQSYRWSDLDFEANLKDGIAVDWPIRYADIAPWYDYVEEFAGISGQAEGLPQLPDGKFLPPMEMTCAEQIVRDGIAKHFDDRIMTIGRSAVLTRVHKGRAGLPLLRRLPPRLHHAIVFQQSELHAARRNENRQADDPALQRCAQPDL